MKSGSSSGTNEKWPVPPPIHSAVLPGTLCNRCCRPMAWSWPGWENAAPPTPLVGAELRPAGPPEFSQLTKGLHPNSFFPPYYFPGFRYPVSRIPPPQLSSQNNTERFRHLAPPHQHQHQRRKTQNRRQDSSTSSTSPMVNLPPFLTIAPCPPIYPLPNPNPVKIAAEETAQNEEWKGKRTGPRSDPDALPDFQFGFDKSDDQTEDDMKMIPELDCRVWEKEDQSAKTEEKDQQPEPERKPYVEKIKVALNRKLASRNCKHFKKIAEHLEGKHKR